MGVGTGGVAYATEFLVCRMHFPHDCDYERVRIEPTTSSLPKWSKAPFGLEDHLFPTRVSMLIGFVLMHVGNQIKIE